MSLNFFFFFYYDYRQFYAVRLTSNFEPANYYVTLWAVCQNLCFFICVMEVFIPEMIMEAP